MDHTLALLIILQENIKKIQTSKKKRESKSPLAIRYATLARNFCCIDGGKAAKTSGSIFPSISAWEKKEKQNESYQFEERGGDVT